MSAVDTGTLEPVGDTAGGAFLIGVRHVGAGDRHFARTSPAYAVDRDVNFGTIVVITDDNDDT